MTRVVTLWLFSWCFVAFFYEYLGSSLSESTETFPDPLTATGGRRAGRELGSGTSNCPLWSKPLPRRLPEKSDPQTVCAHVSPSFSQRKWPLGVPSAKGGRQASDSKSRLFCSTRDQQGAGSKGDRQSARNPLSPATMVIVKV